MGALDDIANIEGFGHAMAAAGWAVEHPGKIVFPGFFREMNTDPRSPGERLTPAERQARRRAKARDCHADVTENVTESHAESHEMSRGCHAKVTKSHADVTQNVTQNVTESHETSRESHAEVTKVTEKRAQSKSKSNKGASPPLTPGTFSDLTSDEIESTADFSELNPDGARAPASFEIPPELNTPEFVDAWSRWVAFRKSRRKPVTAIAAKEQFADLSKFGPTVAVQAIRQSIKNDYQGLFPEKVRVNHGRGAAPSRAWPSGAVFPGDEDSSVPGEL